MSTSEIAKLLLDHKAVSLSPQKPFTYTSGIKSPIYCDNRLLISYPQARETLIESFLRLLPNEVDVIAGVATAGIPHAAFIADRLKKPMIYVRAKAKSHGKQNQIEGHLEKGQRVAVIEDLISTGQSAIDACHAISEAGGEVIGCWAIFSYGLQKAKQAFESEQISLTTLTNFDSLLAAAKGTHNMNENDLNTLQSWQKDPTSWSQQHSE